VFLGDGHNGEAAKQNDKLRVEELVKQNASIDMVLIGAHDGKHSDLCWWAIERGACLLWTIQQLQETSISISKYNKNISMLKGPGEVTRGTFLK